MAVDYQLMQFATRVGTTTEVTDGTDDYDSLEGNNASAKRVRWFGEVLNIPTLREDYMHRDYQSLGHTPGPQKIAQHGTKFELEIESLWNADNDGEQDLGLSDMIGRLIGDFNLRFTASSVAGLSVGDTITGVTSGATGTVTAINGLQVSYKPTNQIMFQSSPGEVFFAALTLDSNIDAPVSHSRPLPTHTVEYGWRDPLGIDSWYHRLKGCKVHSITISCRAEDLVTIRTMMYGRIHDDFSAEISGASGFAISDLIEHVNPGLHFKDINWTFTGPNFDLTVDSTLNYIINEVIVGSLSGAKAKVRKLTSATVMAIVPITGVLHSSGAETITGQRSTTATATTAGTPVAAGDIQTDVVEFDITITQNLKVQYADNQSFDARHLIEGKRRFTYNLKTIKKDNDFLDISRNRPGLPQGQMRTQVAFNQKGLQSTDLEDAFDGPFLDIDMPITVLAERDAPLGQDIENVDESFAGMASETPPLLNVRDIGRATT